MTRPASEPVSWKPVVKVCILVVVVLACLIVIKLLRLDVYIHNPEWRRSLQKSMGLWLPALYVLMGTFLIAAGLLRTLYTFLGGALFGFVMGALWGHVATMTGSMLTFWFARSLGREWADRKFGKKFARLQQRLRDEGFAIMLLVRLCPVGNNFITSCLAGASAMRAWPFFNASLIGNLPMTIFSALLGSGLVKSEHHKTTISLIGFALTALIFVVYFRRSKVAREVARELRGESNGDKKDDSSKS